MSVFGDVKVFRLTEELNGLLGKKHSAFHTPLKVDILQIHGLYCSTVLQHAWKVFGCETLVFSLIYTYEALLYTRGGPESLFI